MRATRSRAGRPGARRRRRTCWPAAGPGRRSRRPRPAARARAWARCSRRREPGAGSAAAPRVDGAVGLADARRRAAECVQVRRVHPAEAASRGRARGGPLPPGDQPGSAVIAAARPGDQVASGVGGRPRDDSPARRRWRARASHAATRRGPRGRRASHARGRRRGGSGRVAGHGADPIAAGSRSRTIRPRYRGWSTTAQGGRTREQRQDTDATRDRIEAELATPWAPWASTSRRSS